MLSEEHIEADINLLVILSEGEARRLKFLGSPTVRINWEDVELGIEERTDYHGHCGMYLYHGQVFEWQPKEMIQESLKKFL